MSFREIIGIYDHMSERANGDPHQKCGEIIVHLVHILSLSSHPISRFTCYLSMDMACAIDGMASP